uniref:SH3 domain-containing protein n=1 Tax=Syphacia muris TaxID=451379 RepID=A0A0N5AFV1_9BILA
MNRQLIQDIYVPAPDYDDPVPDVPEPESLTSPTTNLSYPYPYYQQDANLNQTAPASRQPNYTRTSNSTPTQQQEYQRHVPTQNSTASGSQNTTATSPQPTERPNKITHRHDSEYGLTDSNTPDDYQYRIEKLVHSPKQAHHSKEDIKRYIKAVGGVPIFPPPLPNDQPMFPPIAPSIDVSNNLAFKQHVKNHMLYDTLGSFRSCDKCEICKSYLGETDRAQIASLEKRTKSSKKGQKPSLIISGEAYQKIQENAMETLNALDEYMTEDNNKSRAKITTEHEDLEPEEPEPLEFDDEVDNGPRNYKGSRVQALVDVKGRNPDEIDAYRGEIFEVVAVKSLFWKVKNSQGRTGWIPIQYIYIVQEY